MYKYIPKEQRKKLLFISDTITGVSGVANVSKDLIAYTAHHFNYISIGVSLNKDSKGKTFDLSQAINSEIGITDSQVTSVEWDRYADPEFIRQVLMAEKPDALVFITDPRQYIDLFAMEYDIRTGAINGKPCPMIYIQVWDNLPQPNYNSNFYKSVDMSLCINKQTVLINEMILKEDKLKPIIKYFPHGVNVDKFKPISKDDESILALKERLLGTSDTNLVVFFNSRNIRRKCVSDLIMAFKGLLRVLSENQAKKVFLVLHTHPTDENGTDLPKVVKALLGSQSNQVVFDTEICSPEHMNLRYNMADITCLISNAEGFGLSGLESLAAGTPVIVNVTGGMQDYCRFEDENGYWFTPNEQVWSNHNKTYTKHGEWAFPVYPSVNTIIGSIATPYIFEDVASFRDITDRLIEVYEMNKHDLQDRGLKGREWIMSEEAKMSLDFMTESFISSVDNLLEIFEPRKAYSIDKVNTPKKNIEIEFPDYIFQE